MRLIVTLTVEYVYKIPMQTADCIVHAFAFNICERTLLSLLAEWVGLWGKIPMQTADCIVLAFAFNICERTLLSLLAEWVGLWGKIPMQTADCIVLAFAFNICERALLSLLAEWVGLWGIVSHQFSSLYLRIQCRRRQSQYTVSYRKDELCPTLYLYRKNIHNNSTKRNTVPRNRFQSLK